MSRSWERKVRKNTKLVNKQRQKVGSKPISSSMQDSMEIYKGRNIIFPLFLIGFSVYFYTAFYGIYEGSTMFWITGACYLFLGLYLFFLRTPYLAVGKKQIRSRRFGGDKTVDAEQVEQIDLTPGYVVINFKGKRSKWVFSRLFNRFKTNEMAERLKQFAKDNHIAVNE